MNYPKQILPEPSYKIIDCDIAACYLLRHVEVADINMLVDPETNLLYVGAICSPQERIEDLSMSLLGHFTVPFIHIAFHDQAKDKFMHYCAPDAVVDTPVYETEFYSKPDRACWYLLIGDVNNKLFKYQRSNQDLVATCRVVHTPMLWNFWHFSIRWSTDQGDLQDMSERERNKIAQKIGFAARVTFSKAAKTNVDSHVMVPESCYCKN